MPPQGPAAKLGSPETSNIAGMIYPCGIGQWTFEQHAARVWNEPMLLKNPLLDQTQSF
jgi:hypothetical protein